nr:hypothetical protein [Pseudomonas syringae]UVN18013.1 hypothetical protein pPsy0479b_00055 [Pseudomonas syringae]
MLMISDFPAEPLLKASAAKKGSLLGVTSLGYLLSYGSTGEKRSESSKQVVVFFSSE